MAITKDTTRLRPLPRRVPYGRRLAALLLATTLSSCFTGVIWGFFPQEDHDDPDAGMPLTYERGTKWSWELVLGRILVTPFTLVLDCVTLPVQAVLFGWNDDDEAKRPCPQRRP
ncbi:MAG: hypothetical protein K8J09_05640 [Planctomycetes bacterium]|nr:hypothetical protein [Planctomycetota bacterium]MCC7396537.1 hypothetical protein [Planctomycetota bacterium]